MKNELTGLTKQLYASGLQVLQATGNDTDAEKKKLMAACKDVETLDSLCRENCDLYARTIPTNSPSADWTRLMRVDKLIMRLTIRLIGYARKYGWSPMGRAMIRRKISRMRKKAETPDDPMEAVLTANEERMQPEAILFDPMEEVLTAHEPKNEQQKTDISADALYAANQSL